MGEDAVKKYILIVEDEAIYAKLLQEKLTEEGYEVKVVGDGKSAMSSLKKRQPDLVLLDIILPIMDGYELLEKLQKDGLKDLKVLVISNLGQDKEIKRAKDLGVIDFITKTDISLKETIAKVNQAIS